MLRLAARPRTALLSACALTALVVSVVAHLDHRHTQQRHEATQVAGWYCKYRGTRCDEPQPGPIHARWEVREYTYKVTFGLASLAFVVAAAAAARARVRA
jgi:hypothetical protein